jgi:UDP-glucose 4-epimerase
MCHCVCDIALTIEDFSNAPFRPVMAKVGITGATGFIGGALAPRLADAGYEVVLVDNRTGPLRIESARWPATKEDFASRRGLDLLSRCDIIVHLAAVSGVMACVQDPVATARVNVEGTQRLVSMCEANHIPLAFASSFAVVGNPNRLPVSEGTPPQPTHEYGRQKAEGERIVSQLSGARAASTAIVRMSNVYGTYLSDSGLADKANVISLFLRQSTTGRLVVNAPGTQRRNFVHIDDVVAHWAAAVRFLLTDAEPLGHVFNCASPETFSILELAEKVVRLCRETRPEAADVAVQIVPNPRASVEVLGPEFEVEREITTRVLGVTCHRSVEEAIRKELQARFLSRQAGP